MRETRTSGSMSGVRRRSDGAERGTDEIAKAFGNSYAPSLWQPRLTPTLPSEMRTNPTRLMHERIAELAIGISTLRNQGAPGVVSAAREFLKQLDLAAFRGGSRERFEARLN